MGFPVHCVVFSSVCSEDVNRAPNLVITTKSPDKVSVPCGCVENWLWLRITDSEKDSEAGVNSELKV